MDHSITSALDWLASRDAPESAIAAHEFDLAESDEDARRWIRWLVDQEQGGTWKDDLLETVKSLLILRELREAAGIQELDPAIGRGLDWVRGRRGQPGAWTDGCDPERHAMGVCHHFAGGFFSPGPRSALFEGVRHPSGAPLAGDAEARFVVSATALRCLLEWRPPSTDTRIHADVLRRVVVRWSEAPPSGLTTTALLTAIHALLRAPGADARASAVQGLEWIARRQRGDGSWADADAFHAMAVLTTAVESGVDSDRLWDALGHGARLLRAAQRADGSWGPDYGPRRGLIAVRTLRAEERAP